MTVSSKFTFTADVLRQNFERALKKALTEGVPAPSDSGLEYEVEKALIAVALAYPKVAGLEAIARKAFDEQLQGNS